MFMRQLRVAVIVMGFAASAGPALGADADVLREAADRAEIQELMWRYVRALDSLDADAYASVFTEDGKFSSGQSAEAGRPALKKMVEGLKAGRDQRAAAGEQSAPMYHVITNAHIEFTGKDTARYHSYWMTVFGAAGQGSTPRVAAAGRGVDELVRVDGQWLIKDRNVAPRD
jgi:uncharacterized protein (TIGR02246 family)